MEKVSLQSSHLIKGVDRYCHKELCLLREELLVETDY